MLADLYPMRRKLKNFWMHPNENLCRSLDLFGQDVYHNRTMLPPRETMLGSNLCKRTLQRCLCTNLPQFRRYSVCPNIQGDFGWSTHGLFTVATGVFKGISRSSDYFASASPDGTADYARVELDSSIGSSVFGNSSSVQPSALRVLTLIRSY